MAYTYAFAGLFMWALTRVRKRPLEAPGSGQ